MLQMNKNLLILGISSDTLRSLGRMIGSPIYIRLTQPYPFTSYLGCLPTQDRQARYTCVQLFHLLFVKESASRTSSSKQQQDLVYLPGPHLFIRSWGAVKKRLRLLRVPLGEVWIDLLLQQTTVNKALGVDCEWGLDRLQEVSVSFMNSLCMCI